MSDAKVTVKLKRRGPLMIEGDFELQDADGKPLACASRVALCRCGTSGNKPFCDGSHNRISFESEPAPQKEAP